MSKEPKIRFELDLIDREGGVVSANECTGLVQIPPENDWEEEAYRHIYRLPGEEKDRRK